MVLSSKCINPRPSGNLLPAAKVHTIFSPDQHRSAQARFHILELKSENVIVAQTVALPAANWQISIHIPCLPAKKEWCANR
jgi:hypothetical protein